MARPGFLLVVLVAVLPAMAKGDRCPEGRQKIFTGDCVSKCEKGTVPVIGGGCTVAPSLLKDEPISATTDQLDEFRTSYERMAEEEQTVVRSFAVRFILEPDGKIGRIDITGGGNAEIREALIQRVRMRVYQPATVDGSPVAVYMTSTYTF